MSLNFVRMTHRNKLRLLILLTGAVVAVVLSLGRIPQTPVYHHFCDERTIAGIPHFGDVVSSLGFFIVGTIGLFRVWNSTGSRKLRRIYSVVFAGIFITGVGSMVYHWHPNDGTLLYDRLPMTLVFMGITAAVLEESIPGVGAALLWPLLAAGLGSVWWWRYTEAQSAGDLRGYILVQYYPMVLIPLTLLLFPGAQIRRGWPPLLLCFGCYGLAKAVESLDCPIFSMMGWISGHTIKHLLSALAVYFLVLRFHAMHNDHPSRANAPASGIRKPAS